MSKDLKTIMLVEDEVDIQTIERISLQTLGGFTVHICSSGQEALDQVSTVMPDLIILDMMMPGMDGLTTLKFLKEDPKLKAIPVIFMTAKAQSNERKHYLESGAIGVITKPFDPIKLAAEIKTMWTENQS